MSSTLRTRWSCSTGCSGFSTVCAPTAGSRLRSALVPAARARSRGFLHADFPPERLQVDVRAPLAERQRHLLAAVQLVMISLQRQISGEVAVVGPQRERRIRALGDAEQQIAVVCGEGVVTTVGQRALV